MLNVVARFLCVAGLIAAVAAAQTPVISFEAIRVNSITFEKSTGHLEAFPGDIITVEILVRDWSPNGEVLRAYQATMDADGYTSGQAGNIKPLDFDVTSAKGEENAANSFVDPTNPNFIHAGLETIPLADSISFSYRWLSVLLDPGQSPLCPQDGHKYYTGTLRLRVSDDAKGSFSLGLNEGLDVTGLRDPMSQTISPLGFERLNVDVLEASPAGRIESSDPPNNAIDARASSPTGGSAGGGRNTIALTFSADTSGLSPSDFTIVDGTSNPPRIGRLVTNGPVVAVVLDRPMLPGAWTTITHDVSRTKVTIGCLPGDVNNDGIADANDILALAATSRADRGLPAYRGDINGDGVSDISDAVGIIDALTEPAACRRILRK